MSTLKEQIAAIIAGFPASHAQFSNASLSRWADAKCKADRIIALLPLQGEGEVVDARQAIENWFAPWGSWKTAWWEDFAGDDREYTSENFIKALGKQLRRAAEAYAKGGEKGASRDLSPQPVAATSVQPAASLATATVHELKTWPEPFAAVKSGAKPFEYRKNDRNYRVGDILWLREWSPSWPPGEGSYTGDELRRVVTFILPQDLFGVPKGYCVMGIPAGAPAMTLTEAQRLLLEGRK